MKRLWSIFLVSLLPQWSSEVDLSVQGSVSMGQDVVEALSHYIDAKKFSGRRSYDPQPSRHHETKDPKEPKDEDKKSHKENENTIAAIVESANLCRNVDLCKGELAVIFNKYIIMLAESIESAFQALVNDINHSEQENSPNEIIFVDELKQLIKEVKKILMSSDIEKERNIDETYTWINTMKKINSQFIDKAISFASQRLEGSAQEISEVKKKLTQQIVIFTSAVELKFEKILCSKYSLCVKIFECTNSLNTILEHLDEAPNDKIKEFVKTFNNELPAMNFYNKLSDETTNEFEKILKEMINSEIYLAKSILSVVHKSVDERQNAIVAKFKKDDKGLSKDVRLVHIILSDMDFIYSKQDLDSFQDFIGDFRDWLKGRGRIGSSLRRVMKDIQNKVSFAPIDLVSKLINEVKVFMEITVGPN